MTSMKIEANSLAGEIFAADVLSGAVKFDDAKGAFFKPSTQQEYLLTNKDRLVRVDGAVGTLNEYNKGLKDFCPIDALQDGEKFDRARKLTKNDVLAKPTWKQWAGESALVVAQGAVTGAALGAIGGAIYGIATHRRSLPSTSVTNDTATLPLSGNHAGKSGIGVARQALHAPGPFHPGDLRGPDPININPPPAPGLTPGQAAKEQAAQGAFAAAGAIVGGAVAGPLAPVGAIIGGVIGAGIGALWNEAVR